VARETVRAWREIFPGDAVTVLEQGGQRYSLQAQREWPALRRAHHDATWVWFHWDVPWRGVPARSVVYVHDLIHFADANPIKRWVARRWVGHALRSAGRVVTGSQAMAARLPRVATVIPHGVSGEFGGAWTPGDYVLTVGEDRPHKNLALVAKLDVPWKRACGVSEDDLNALYAGARAVLVPSLDEGFGLPILEAAAHRLPIVCSDLPALRRLAGDAALYVGADDDPGRVAERILQRLDADPVARLAAEVRTRRTWDAVYRERIAPLLAGDRGG